MRWYVSTRARLGLALGVASLASVCLFLVSALRNHTWALYYLSWNLFLAWVPLLLSLWLLKVLRTHLWSSWRAIILTLFWLGFLPNSFYIVTDFIHLQDAPSVDLVFDVVMFGSFILNGFLIGLISLYLVHGQLRWRMRNRNSTLALAGIIFLVSFAIYIGRDLRWNTWDVLLNPASLLFDVSDRLLHAGAHPEMFTATFGFFVLIGTVYGIAWHAAKATRQQRMPE